MKDYTFKEYRRGDDHGSNYRLLGKPVQLNIKIYPVFDAPGTDTWESEGGAPVPLPYETTMEQEYASRMRIRGARRQRAAKAYIPRESIKVVKLSEPAPLPVVKARFENRLPKEIKIAELEAKIQALLGLVRK